MKHLDPVAISILNKLSPSGTLFKISNLTGANPDLDAALDQFDIDEAFYQQIKDPSLISKLEDDFAAVVPLLELGAGPLESWAIPLLAALAGPGAPLLSVGLTLACKVALAALDSWAKKRNAQKKT
jgi:hypothetical protein